MNAYLLIAISFALVLTGFLVPFLMVLQVLEPSMVLSFSGYFLSLGGLVLGIYGTVHFNDSRRRDDS